MKTLSSGLGCWRQGERIRYEPSAVVYHTVSEERVRKKYYLDWWFDKGRADIRQFGIPPNAWCVLGIPLYLFRRVAVWTLRWMVTLDPPRRFHSKLAVWAKAGRDRGMLPPLASRDESTQ